MKPVFRFIPISTEVAEAARRGVAENKPDHRLVTVDSPHSAPCRHCLRWAQPGERVILFPFNAVPDGHPYSETGPIFVHADGCERYQQEDQYPSEFQTGRVFRAYNSRYDLIAAELPNGDSPEAVIEKLMENPETTSVHVRSASHGCYTFKVERK
jgi:hypothetical protein